MTPTPTSTPRVDVDALGLVGLACDAAAAKAHDAGLQATCTPGDPAPAADQVGKVYNVNPTGKVPQGSSITLTFYADRTQPPKPGSAPTFTGDMVAGGTITVSWGADYVCPSGTSITGYIVTIDGGFTLF